MELRIRTYIHIHRVTGVRPTNHRAKLSTARERERERGVEADRVTSRIIYRFYVRANAPTGMDGGEEGYKLDEEETWWSATRR